MKGLDAWRMSRTGELDEDCGKCGGTGQIDENECAECEGSGRVSPHHEYEPMEDRYDE